MTEQLHSRQVVTAGQLRALLDGVPADTPLLIGIRDRHHFNTLLGELGVIGVTVMRSGDGRAIVLEVATVD